MKKVFTMLLVAATLMMSCEKGPREDFTVRAYSINPVPFEVVDYIIAPDGWAGEWGETLSFTAIDPPGYEFVKWVKDPNINYAYRIEPIVDPDNHRTTFVQGDLRNMRGQNHPNRKNYLAALYIRVN